MSPSPEEWREIEKGGSEIEAQIKKWESSRLPNGQFLCKITTPTGKELQGLIDAPFLVRIGSLQVPVLPGLQSTLSDSSVSQILANRNGKELGMEGLKIGDGEKLDEATIRSLGFELNKEYKGGWSTVEVIFLISEGGGSVMEFDIFPPDDIRRLKTQTKDTQIAIGVAKGFTEVFPDWNIEPQSEIKI